MKLLLLVGLVFVCQNAEAIDNLIGTEIQKCLNCLCHARTGCWRRLNCAEYSINMDYWKKAGSPSIGGDSVQDAYEKCMTDENCILNTVKNYTESFGRIDCNCDNVFDCKDRFSIHIFGPTCYNPDYGKTYAKRFNDCASEIGVAEMVSHENNCVEEPNAQ